MVKIITILILTTITITSQSIKLNESCLNCHIKQKIPSELIYRRYLMRYSTDEMMQEAIFNYLKKPNKTQSIMPKQFFLKFPMKEVSDNNSSILKQNIKEYLNYFNIKKKLK